MYYDLDENGNFIMSSSSEILPDVYQDIFPASLDQEDYVNFETVSGGDLFGQSSILDNTDSSGFYMDYPSYIQSLDYLYDTLANIPSYTVFPNTAAVSVFRDVLNGVDDNIGYVILSGADTYSTYLYYSSNFSVSGSSITLSAPVKLCTYYQYRTSTSSPWMYTYTVQDIGESVFNLSNQLVYTNIIDGYPDLIEYKSVSSYSLLFICAASTLICALSCFSSRFRSKRREK